jgi:transcriptional regulator with XRE-family HTH domain
VQASTCEKAAGGGSACGNDASKEAGLMQRLIQAQTQTDERSQRLLEQVGRRIRALRESQNLTQEELASRCGISVSFASLLERGERAPSYETLVQVADALRISVSDLCREGQEITYDDPYFQRLMEFARASRLSREQVDRLLAVAHAMFGGANAEAPKPVMVESLEAPRCSEDGCARRVLAKRLCASHYHRRRRGRL